MWIGWFIFAMVCFVATIVIALVRKKKYKSGRMLDTTTLLAAGVVVTAVALFIPVYYHLFMTGDYYSHGETKLVAFLMAIHNTIRLFVVDGDFTFVVDNVAAQPEWLYRAYIVLFGLLFVYAPALTFGIVLSFFKNASAHYRYFCSFFKDVYVFSELNEKSLALARSLRENGKGKRVFVFTDVFEKEEEESYELLEKAGELQAIIFKKDIVTINFGFHWKNSALNFFAIGEDEDENVDQALKLVEKLKYREKTNLFVFSTRVEAEILLANAFAAEGKEKGDHNIKIKVRRVNEVRSLINHNLYEKGYNAVFNAARPGESDLEHINALVVGMGCHGVEMTKALAWFCQMDGYRVQINSVDIDPKAETRFLMLCPELMQFNGKLDDPGDAQYTIHIHSGVDVRTVEFEQLVEKLPRTTYVFVALGDDERNVETAVRLRALFSRLDHDPVIQAVVYSSDKQAALENVVNHQGSPYDIDFIGDICSCYSEDVIIESDLEEIALSRHKKWGSENSFWRFDYNYKSSIASAIHRKMKVACRMPGAGKAPDERTEDELWALRRLEHRRWNAYMRSEGFRYSGSLEKSSRNDMAKLHNCLVTFDKLPLNEQIKDDY